jgi:hypothetical protein
MKEVNFHGSVLDNNLLFILKIHPGSPENPPGSQLFKNTNSAILEQSFSSTFHSAFCSACLNSQHLSQFISPKENQVAKPFLTSKQDKKSHGVPDGYEVDAGNFRFSLRYLQVA